MRGASEDEEEEEVVATHNEEGINGGATNSVVIVMNEVKRVLSNWRKLPRQRSLLQTVPDVFPCWDSSSCAIMGFMRVQGEAVCRRKHECYAKAGGDALCAHMVGTSCLDECCA